MAYWRSGGKDVTQEKNIFVLGMNEANRRRLEKLPRIDNVALHTLLTYEGSHGARTYDAEAIYQRARERLKAFDRTVDGIIGFWDFPVSTILPMLCDEWNLTGPTLESVLRCEHKSWSRRLQAEVVPELTPRFQEVDPYDEDEIASIELGYPYWLKPIKSFAGHLGFRIDGAGDLERALARIQRGLPRFSEPFQWVLDHGDLPDEVSRRGARLCVAEELIGGWQCTVEGVVLQGDVHVHGVIDSHTVPGMSVFDRFEYPSELPDEVKDRMREASAAIINRIGYDNRAFNIEYFWDESSGDIKLLEINPRISQSHSYLFHAVDGVSNHAVVVSAALGEVRPWPRGDGQHSVAGKFFIRSYLEDGRVVRTPREEDLARVEALAPGAEVGILAREGDRLSDIPYQDSYSYKLAIVYLAADDRDQLHALREEAVAALPFEIEEV